MSVSVLSKLTGEGVIRVFFFGGICNVADPGSQGGINVFLTDTEADAGCTNDDTFDGDDTAFWPCGMYVPSGG